MSYRFSRRSLEVMKAFHPDLSRVLQAGLPDSPHDFGIDPNSVRDEETQRRLVSQGRSKTMRSRHLPRLIRGWEQHGPVVCAADLFVYRAGRIVWDMDTLREVARHLQETAATCGVEWEWGGDWTRFVDAPHHQLAHRAYPESPEGQV